MADGHGDGAESETKSNCGLKKQPLFEIIGHIEFIYLHDSTELV